MLQLAPWVEARSSASSAAGARALRWRAERCAKRRGARQGRPGAGLAQHQELGNALLGAGCACVHQRQLRHHVLRQAVHHILDLSELLLGLSDHGVELLVVVVDLALEARELHPDAVNDSVHRILGVADRRLQLETYASDRRGLIVQATINAAAPHLQGRSVDRLRRRRLLLRQRESCGSCGCHGVRCGEVTKWL